MGTDCTIYSPSGHEDLDRWHVFSDVFDAPKIMDRADALERLRGLCDGSEYAVHWAKRAIEFVERSGDQQFAFVHDSGPLHEDLWEADGPAAKWGKIVESQKEET